ncbi:MAG: HAMP domain-containing protein [Candidatus Omnitrophica bacterium]|nr:HAMP domain-containing protein [Candidatus Omnitrophota bacterium]
MKIRQKSILGPMGLAVLIGIVTYISIQKIQDSLVKAIGNGATVLAQETLDKIDRNIYLRLEDILLVSEGLKVQEAIIQSNQEFDQMPDPQAFIAEKDKEWVSAPKEAVTPFMREILDAELSQELKKQIEFYEQKYGYKVFSEIFAANKYGVNVVQSGKTTDFRQDDEEWWQSAKKNGLYIRDVQYDESAKTRSIDMGVRVGDENGNFIGVIKAVLNIKGVETIIDTIKESSEYKSINIELVSKDGSAIYGTGKNTSSVFSASILNEFKESEKHAHYLVKDYPGENKKLIVHAHERGYRIYEGLGWSLIIQHDASEVFAPAIALRNILIGVSLGVMAAAFLGALLFSRSLSLPITKLEKAAAEISRGRLDVQVNIKSKDEIGFLANAFNRMVGHLKDQRRKVEKRTNELTTLYEVSNTIPYTADFQQLLKLVMESVFKIIDYDICGALLLNMRAANIVIRPSYPQSVKYADEIKETLIREFSKFQNEQVHVRPENVRVVPVEGSRPMPQTRMPEELKSSFNAPILAGGKIIGILNFSSVREDVFSADEVKFIYTMTNQVSNEIERLQAMISAEKSKIESMIESMQEGVVMLDDEGNAVVLNPQAREMLGLSYQEETVDSALHEQMKLVNLDAALEESGSTDDVVVREVMMPHNDRRILQCTVSPVGLNERRIGTVIIFRDVTREREVDAMKTEFISMVSHELRTPLSITKEGLNLILDKVAGDITQKQEMILSAAKENMDRLSRLINNVLDISKMEAGKMETKKEQFNIVRLAEKVLSTFELKAKERNIGLRLRFSDQNIDVFADRDKIIQVFTNLINNALKFTLEGSIEVSGKVEGEFVECVVADTGIGISKNDLARTFVKFQQFGRQPGSGEKGTGLGLTIAKGIIEMHGGKIWVESELGVGTKFIFTVPKFSPESPLRDFVESGIKEAQKSNARMSLLAMTMEGRKEGDHDFPEEKRLGYLENLKNVLKEEVHRPGDAVFRDSKGCFVTLFNCNKDHAHNVCSRFKKALDEYLVRERLDSAISLKMGSATYPIDAKDSRELLKKAITA